MDKQQIHDQYGNKMYTIADLDEIIDQQEKHEENERKRKIKEMLKEIIE